MNRMARRSRRDGGFALVTVLALTAILAMMIAAAIQGNVAQRKYLRLREDEARARCLAESGIAEALRAIANQAQTPSLERTTPDGTFRVAWKETSPRLFEIRATGSSQFGSCDPVRRAVTVVASAPLQGPMRILSWAVSSGD